MTKMINSIVLKSSLEKDEEDDRSQTPLQDEPEPESDGNLDEHIGDVADANCDDEAAADKSNFADADGELSEVDKNSDGEVDKNSEGEVDRISEGGVDKNSDGEVDRNSEDEVDRNSEW